MKRRHFLQSAATTLAALGISQLTIQHQAFNYAKVLAQSTPRKRALLVGINEYVPLGNSGWHPLQGAVHDVEMQGELLVHRFGFQPGDIHCLKNEQAKRENILTAFEDLIQWSKPGDVVVFHYSGHGSTVDDPDLTFADHLNGTIVPCDSDLPPAGGAVDDITSGTLFLLLSALKTDSVTAILDSCYAGGGLRGNLVIRARPGQADLLLRGETTAKYVASDTERQYQEKLLDEWQRSQQKTRQDWIKQRQTGLAKGVALLAARRNQEAADAAFSGNLHAGVFTYALTRYLWQQTRNQAMGSVLIGTTATTERLLKTLDGKSHEQTPELQEQPNSSNQKKPTYFLPDFTSTQTQPAEAVVVGVSGRGRTGDKVQVLLSGVDPQALESFGQGAQLKIVDAAGRAQGTIALTGKRDGLKIEGQVTLKPGATIAPGAMLQEEARSIPVDWSLRIGLDSSLGNEAAIARQELPQIHSRIVPVPLLQQEVHYILGRMTQPVYDALQQRRLPNVPAVGSLGLFYAGLEPLPESFGSSGESLTKALQGRFLPKFKFLLAGRLLKLMLNASSTWLKVKAAVQVAGQREFAAQAIAVRGGGQVATPRVEPAAKQIRINDKIQVMVENNEANPLNCAVVFLGPEGKVQPLQFTAKIPAGGTITLPDRKVTVTVEPPSGMAEVMAIFSTASLDRAIAQLQILADTRTAEGGEQAVATVDTLLDDLSETRSGGQTGDRRLSTDQMAALSVSFEIIP